MLCFVSAVFGRPSICQISNIEEFVLHLDFESIPDSKCAFELFPESLNDEELLNFLRLGSILFAETVLGNNKARELFLQIDPGVIAVSSRHQMYYETLKFWLDVDNQPRFRSMLEHVETSVNLKIYVYKYQDDLQQKLLPSKLKCAYGQWATEVFFYKLLTSLDSKILVDDPEEADLFFVPVFSTCLVVKEKLGFKETGDYIYRPLLEFLNSQITWKRNHGMDHIFLFPDGQSISQFPFYDFLQNSILLMTESNCVTWDTAYEEFSDLKKCMHPLKDIVIPGHTDLERATIMSDHAQDRQVLLSWRGRSSFIHEKYKNAWTRTELVNLFYNLDFETYKTVVGGFSDDFLQTKSNSEFCLVPGGTSPWTNHLYESLIAGCIPVILSDEFDLPFWSKIDWREISIKWPESKIEEDLYFYLKEGIPKETKQQMWNNIQQVSCWVNWWSDDPHCHPFLAIMEELHSKKLALDAIGLRRATRYWNVPPHLTVYNVSRKSRYNANKEFYILLDS
jgi:Exostosin family